MSCRCSGLLVRPRRGAGCGAPGPAATHAGQTSPLLRGLCKAIPANPHGGPGRGAGDDTFKWPPRKAAEQTPQAGSAARGQRREGMDGRMDARMDGCSSLQPGSAHEMPAERRSGLRARPALLPRRASPGCLQVTAGFTPHPSLAAFQMPKPKAFKRCGKRVTGGEQRQSKPASNSTRAPSLRSWTQAQPAFRIPSSPGASLRWRWVRSPS